MWHVFWLTIYLFVSSIKADNIECPPGAIRPQGGNFCYIFNSTLMDFYGAEAECNLHYGHLAYIDSAFTNAAIGTEAKNLPWNQYWIGAHVVKQTMNDASVKIWVWTDSNRLVTYSDWYMDEPNLNNSCTVGKTLDFSWQSINCGEEKPFVCSIPIKINFCDDGWAYFSETKCCYKVFFNKTWDDGENYCQGKNAHLTSIHNETENAFVFDLAKTDYSLVNSYNSTWIGLYTNSTNTSDVSSYKWIDGSPTDYFYWWFSQPDNTNESCVNMFADPSTMYTVASWNNFPCFHLLRNFVCKKLANFIQEI